ncbi:PLP-dependent aminotransferase family protein [soil metagenome]
MTSWVPALSETGPRYLAIADAITHDLSSGKLKPGDRLPPQRELAWKLGVTLGTVTRGYQEAQQRGLLSGEVGRGSYLREPGAAMAAVQSMALSEPGVLNLQISAPPRIHQLADLEAAFRDIARDPAWHDLLDYSPTAGFPAHLAMGAAWLAKSDVTVSPDQVVLSAGAQAALITTLATLSRPGETLMIEPLTYPTMQPIAQHFGLHLRAIQADGEGVLPESIERHARHGEARLLYLVPTLHNPTSVTLSAERRAAIADLARRHDFTIIEDDVFRLLSADPPPPIQALAPERTYYITSLSKTMAPGLRVAFIAPPPGAAEALNRQQMVIGGRPTALAAEVARRWLDSGVAERALVAIRQELAARREIVLEVFRGLDFACNPGAMSVWTQLPARWKPGEFASATQAMGVKVTPGNAFAMDPLTPHQAFRACLGPTHNRASLKDGLARLRALMEQGRADEFQNMA